MKTKLKEKTYNSDSYSLGWLDRHFITYSSLSESEARRYLELCHKTGYEGEIKVIEYIKKYYPILKNYQI